MRASALVQLLVVLLSFSALAAACAGAPPSMPPQSSSPTDGSPFAEIPEELRGRTWLAEGGDGWEAGLIAGRSVRLGPAEVGLAARDQWILSTVVIAETGASLLIRDASLGEPRRVDLGMLAPSAVSILGDAAFVSGFSLRDSLDPGILHVDLASGTTSWLLEPSNAPGTRYVAASADGSTLVSVLCDLSTQPEPKTCDLMTVSLPDQTVGQAKQVPGGLLRAASATTAVFAPLGPEPPTWIAGVDLQSGRENWREKGGEYGPSYVTLADGLIQSQIALPESGPHLLIEAMNFETGSVRLVYEEEGLELRSMWPEMSSDVFVAIGGGSGFGRAVLDGGGIAQLALVDLSAGTVRAVEFSVRE